MTANRRPKLAEFIQILNTRIIRMFGILEAITKGEWSPKSGNPGYHFAARQMKSRLEQLVMPTRCGRGVVGDNDATYSSMITLI